LPRSHAALTTVRGCGCAVLHCESRKVLQIEIGGLGNLETLETCKTTATGDAAVRLRSDPDRLPLNRYLFASISQLSVVFSRVSNQDSEWHLRHKLKLG